VTKVKMKVKLGRPKKWNTALELEEYIKEYFKFCQKERLVPGVCGLAVWLGTTRTTLLRHEKYYNDEAINYLISRAKTVIEAYNEQLSYNPKTYQGAQFNLKNNFNYEEKSKNLNVNMSYEDYLRGIEDKDEY